MHSPCAYMHMFVSTADIQELAEDNGIARVMPQGTESTLQSNKQGQINILGGQKHKNKKEQTELEKDVAMQCGFPLGWT